MPEHVELRKNMLVVNFGNVTQNSTNNKDDGVFELQVGHSVTPELIQSSLSNLGMCSDTLTPTYLELNITDKGLIDIVGISFYKNLELLNISKNKLNNLYPLRLLPKLRVLLASENQIRDISELRCSTALEIVDLSKNQIHKIGDWTLNSQLRSLDLSNNLLTSPEGKLESCRCLRKLNLSGNNIMSLKLLPQLDSTLHLDISRNCLSDLRGIHAVPRLITLLAHRNSLKNIEGLTPSAVPFLRVLDIHENNSLIFVNLKCLHPLIHLPALEQLIVSPGPADGVFHLQREVCALLPGVKSLNNKTLTPLQKIEAMECNGTYAPIALYLAERFILDPSTRLKSIANFGPIYAKRAAAQAASLRRKAAYAVASDAVATATAVASSISFRSASLAASQAIAAAVTHASEKRSPSIKCEKCGEVFNCCNVQRKIKASPQSRILKSINLQWPENQY